MYSQRSPQVMPYPQVSNKQWSKLARQGDSHLLPYWPSLPSLFLPFISALPSSPLSWHCYRISAK